MPGDENFQTNHNDYATYSESRNIQHLLGPYNEQRAVEAMWEKRLSTNIQGKSLTQTAGLEIIVSEWVSAMQWYEFVVSKTCYLIE